LMFYTNQLIGLGLITVEYEGYIKTLALNKDSTKVLQGDYQVELTSYDEVKKKPKAARGAKKALGDLTSEDQDLFEILRARRKEIAANEAVPAFVVFGDKTLIDMATRKPKTIEEFGEIHGVGQHKQEKYWDKFEDLLINQE